MIIFSKERSPRSLGALAVQPGFNRFDDKVFEAVARKYSSALDRLHEAGLLELIDDDARDLRDLSIEAAAAVAQQATFEQLMRWRRVEERAPVKRALEERLGSIRRPAPLAGAAQRAFEKDVPVSEIQKMDEEMAELRQQRAKDASTIEEQTKLLALQDQEIAELKAALAKAREEKPAKSK